MIASEIGELENRIKQRFKEDPEKFRREIRSIADQGNSAIIGDDVGIAVEKLLIARYLSDKLTEFEREIS